MPGILIQGLLWSQTRSCVCGVAAMEGTRHCPCPAEPLSQLLPCAWAPRWELCPGMQQPPAWSEAGDEHSGCDSPIVLDPHQSHPSKPRRPPLCPLSSGPPPRTLPQLPAQWICSQPQGGGFITAPLDLYKATAPRGQASSIFPPSCLGIVFGAQRSQI